MIDIQILDAAGRALELSAFAYAGLRPDEDVPFPAMTFFEGIYDSASIYSALEACIYNALDEAQQNELVGESCWLTLK